MLKSLRQRLSQKKISRPSASGIKDWYKKRKARIREENEKQRAMESWKLRLLTASLTFVSLILALSFMPLFPQPLPVLIAFLVAFGAYERPQFSLPVGGVLIGLGMLYHLASMDFIALLGAPEVRVAVVGAFLYLLVALPVRFRTCEDAIAINIGIISAALLFFTQTYLFAIPLLLTTVVLFKKTQAILAVAFYAIISVPFQIMQFSQLIPTITRTEWWLDPLGVPPLYVPLNDIYTQMQNAMVQFRLFDSSKVVYVLSTQLTGSPSASSSAVSSALSQYLDSFPGIILFLTLVVTLIFAVSTITPELTRKSFAMKWEVLFPALAAAGITAMFFILAMAMQRPLAFRVQLNNTQMLVGVVATIIFALPIAYVNYAPRKRAAVEMLSKKVIKKSEELKAKLEAFEKLLEKTKSTLPLDVSSPEGKMDRIKDALEEIISKTNARLYDPPELEAKLSEMDELSQKIDGLEEELDSLIQEYQLLVNYEYTAWLKKVREFGFEIENPVKMVYQKEMPIEERIIAIREMLDSAKVLALEISQTVEQAYFVIRSLYDDSLPEESRVIGFSKQQLEEKKSPWFATEALFSALSNWKKVYDSEVSKSVKNLLTSLDSLVALNIQAEKMQSALGKDYSTVIENLESAEDLKLKIENTKFSVTNLPILKDALETSLNISKEILSILLNQLTIKENSIENLLPVKEDFWEKNTSLKEQTAAAVESIEEAPKQALNKTMQNLPRALLFLNDCLGTLAIYGEKEELLLNYPVAKTLIQNLLKKNKSVSPKELPFEQRFSEKYLMMFYNSQSRRKLAFSNGNLLVSTKKM